MNYKVMRIDEDLDFGCEERPEGMPVMAVVTLADELGQEQTMKVPDRELYEKNINVGDTVIMDENGSLQKADAVSAKTRSYEEISRENQVMDMGQLMMAGMIEDEELAKAMAQQKEAGDNYLMGVINTEEGPSPASVQLDDGSYVLMAWTSRDRVDPMELEEAGVVLDNLISIPLAQLLQILADYASYGITGILINYGIPSEFICDQELAALI